MQITIELPDDQVDVVERALRRGRYADGQQACAELARLAVSSWIDWLSGEQRYTSLTQQHTDWVESIYNHLLREDEAPSADRLYNDFNIPYGKAQYIARVLSNKTLTRWRRRALRASSFAEQA